MCSIDENKEQVGWQVSVESAWQHRRETIPREWQLPTSIMQTLAFPLDKCGNNLSAMSIPQNSGILSIRELMITEELTVKELLAQLSSGEISSLEVTLAFSKRAALAQQLTSCLTETLFDEALARAKYLDQWRSDGNPLAPLHGLPVSLKDGFQIIGTEASIGFVSFLGKKSVSNSPLTEILLELGAVLYVKTNIPQTLMTADTDNNIFGRTLNPRNTLLTAGGSSGGEGALIAFRGSPLGIGTDIAGSVRIPASCCGLYGFKPTSCRIPYGGQVAPSLPGCKPVTASAGPLAHDLESLSILMSAVIGAKPAAFDSTAIDTPWRHVERDIRSVLRIGLLEEDHLYPFHPPMIRALKEAAQRLQAEGHEVIRLSSDEGGVSDASQIIGGLFNLHSETSMEYIRSSGEPLVPCVAKALQKTNSSSNKFTSDLDGLDLTRKYAALTVRRHEFAEKWRKLWLEKGIDAVLGPSAQTTAIPHDSWIWSPYTSILNLLDYSLKQYPACVMPFGQVSKCDFETMEIAEEQTCLNYNPDNLEGMPCSIQVFTNRMRDEECLKIAGVIDDCLKRRSGYEST
ncbi:amidase [Penicillium angulare]|uniref:amidase n=1 Tax=Penicillium angulare TaxID=116970 RepID=UPI0025402017|nr:amidase [Penicillium angulare]KAJ5292215.1 amidase [Penicillium angulare]